MAKVGTIAIDLVASTGKLLAPLKKAENGIGSLASKASSVGGTFMKFAAPLTGFVGGFLTASYAIGKVTEAFADMDNIGKEADRLGIATEELVGLQHAANMAGVSAEQLGGSLQKFLKGGGSMDDLGEVADQMAAMTDPTERMQFALEKFGKSGAGMINMLAGGSAGLKEMQADAEKLGLTFTRVDAAKVEMAGDAVGRINEMIQGVARRIAVELAPFIKYAADSFVSFGTEGTGAAGMVRTGVDMVIKVIGYCLDAIDLLRTAWAAAQLGAQTALAWMVKGGAWLISGVEQVAEAIASAFTWAWTRTQQAFTDTFSWIIQKLADFLAWIDSYLPESMQTGLGAMAQEFAKTYEQIANENRKRMEGEEWRVDLSLGGDSANSIADTMLADAKAAATEFVDFANREKMSDKLNKKVEEIRKNADEAAAAAVATPEMDGSGISDKISVGALEAGSQAAFKAISDTTKTMSIDQQNLEAQKRHTSLLDRIEKNTRQPIAAAGIA